MDNAETIGTLAALVCTHSKLNDEILAILKTINKTMVSLDARITALEERRG